MARPSDRLAESLKVLRTLQEEGVTAIKSSALARSHRERLLRNGFLQEVIKGWYIPARPDDAPRDSTAWYASFWSFCAAYLAARFRDKWSLSPEQSLLLQSGNRTVPRLLLVRADGARNKVTALTHDTSILEVRARRPAANEIVVIDGLRLFSLPAALVGCAPQTFRQYPTDMRAALAQIRDASELLPLLLDNGLPAAAGRLVGALRNIGRDRVADRLLSAMRAAGFKVTEENPFDDAMTLAPPARERSPYSNRIHLMWQAMRQTVIDHVPDPPKRPPARKGYLKAVEDVYITDAYHSLSIEGYRVSAELVDRVRSGRWNPDLTETDREQRNALAARGYWLAFQAVEKSLKRVLNAENAGAVADDDHGRWYQQLFAPSVEVGILRAANLAGYRNGQVYIRRSMHVPLKHEAVLDAMPAYFQLLRDEPHPAVRAVLGHFVFVYIHPYMDGNGRIGRFLMNLMLASGGYPWTVIPVEQRTGYMSALESASVDQKIAPLAKFLGKLVQAALDGKPAAKVRYK
ncbi:MAG: Fic family protein [Steroidobacteraceae bacterium]